jgi:NO-binding membrane sensor protein with MHYT domain
MNGADPNLLDFFAADAAAGGAPLAHDRGLVGLSLLAVLAACYAFLELAAHAKARGGTAAIAWRVAAGLVLGLAMWSTHIIGLLALKTPLLRGVSLEAGLQSAVIALATSAAAMTLAHPANIGRFILAGLLIWAGALGMHYHGVLALSIDASLAFRGPWILASAAAGFVASLAVAPLANALQSTPQRLMMAAPMAAAIGVLYYVDMAALVAAPDPSFQPPEARTGVTGLAALVASLVVAATLGGLAAIRFDLQRPTAAPSPATAIDDIMGDPIVQLPRRMRQADPEAVVDVSSRDPRDDRPKGEGG